MYSAMKVENLILLSFDEVKKEPSASMPLSNTEKVAMTNERAGRSFRLIELSSRYAGDFALNRRSIGSRKTYCMRSRNHSIFPSSVS